MNEHEDDLNDGDLVASSPKIPVPDEVADAVKTLIRWAGDDPDARRAARHAAARRAGVEGILRGL